MKLTTAVLILALVLSCRSSSGDKSPEFRLCLDRCTLSKCSRSVSAFPLPLRLLGWSCEDECKYHCMHQVTQEDVRQNRRVRQFYGKWPFVRVLGVQEPASVLFSLLNGGAVVAGYYQLCTTSPPDYHLRPVLSTQLLVSLNTWLWSAVFHTRDVGWTEKMDYFSAALLIVCGLIVQFVRLSGKGALLWQCVYGGMWMGLYILHVTYLSMSERFNYGYNMAVCVIAGTVYAAVWTAWSIKEWRRRHYVWKCVVAVLWGSCTVLLELLDFPPLLWTVDAHALWHLSTVPIPLLWYSFLADDTKYEMSRHKKKV